MRLHEPLFLRVAACGCMLRRANACCGLRLHVVMCHFTSQHPAHDSAILSAPHRLTRPPAAPLCCSMHAWEDEEEERRAYEQRERRVHEEEEKEAAERARIVEVALLSRSRLISPAPLHLLCSRGSCTCGSATLPSALWLPHPLRYTYGALHLALCGAPQVAIHASRHCAATLYTTALWTAALHCRAALLHYTLRPCALVHCILTALHCEVSQQGFGDGPHSLQVAYWQHSELEMLRAENDTILSQLGEALDRLAAAKQTAEDLVGCGLVGWGVWSGRMGSVVWRSSVSTLSGKDR